MRGCEREASASAYSSSFAGRRMSESAASGYKRQRVALGHPLGRETAGSRAKQPRLSCRQPLGRLPQ
jgi:hypothetical protein